jgi:hypothetical protein
MAASLRLNAAAIDKAKVDEVYEELVSLAKDLAGAKREDDSSLDELRVLTFSAQVCAAVMTKSSEEIKVPRLIRGLTGPVEPTNFLATFCKPDDSAIVMLMTPRTAYNLACALSWVTSDNEPEITSDNKRKGLELLLRRALEQEHNAESARTDPFFKDVRSTVWFTKLVGADPTSEIETTWLTAPYADALQEAGVIDMEQLRKRLRTPAERRSLSQALDNRVGESRLKEWADLLTVHEQADVPLPWLQALDSLAVRSVTELKRQAPALLHDALKVFGSSPKPIPDAPTLTQVMDWVEAAKRHLPP